MNTGYLKYRDMSTEVDSICICVHVCVELYALRGPRIDDTLVALSTFKA